VLFSEHAGRPDYYISGKKQTAANPTNPTYWGCWAEYQSVTYQGWTAAATPGIGGVYSMNRSNSQGIYSFHSGGANVAFSDGSVRFITEEIPVKLMIAFVSRDAGDAVDLNY
jgi:prepilin-type processing-associated H-X9-DG protein